MTERHKIIIVDDSAAALQQAKTILSSFYRVYTVSSADVLFENLEHISPDLILLDVLMPDTDGLEVIKRLKADVKHKDIPVIFLTAKSDERTEIQGLALGAVDYIYKPFSAPLLLKRIQNQIMFARAQASVKHYAENLEDMVEKKTTEFIALNHSIISVVAELIEFRDSPTGGHIARTQKYMNILINALLNNRQYDEATKGWNSESIYYSTQLHDIGKIAISDAILNKPSELTPEEYEIIKTHVPIGVDIIERIMCETKAYDLLHYALVIAGTHHEKYDGTGYPIGLSREDIPLIGRLMAIADVYDALISVRPYKRAFSHKEAIAIIESDAGKHFDPELVKIFLAVEKEIEKIMLEAEN